VSQVPKLSTAKTRSIIYKRYIEASLKVAEHIKLVSPTDMSVLIIGESGKEIIAKGIHENSRRAVDLYRCRLWCYSKELAASEFFGHLKVPLQVRSLIKFGYFES
jgi:two-component system response regulator HydG